MKNSALLMIILLLIFSNESFGDDNSQINDFSDYINSSQGPLKSTVDNSTKPVPAMNHDLKKESNKEGPAPVLKAIPYKWKTCTIDSDCTAVVADCVSWDSLNKKYLKKVSKDLNACSGSIDPGFQPVTVCVDKECKTTEKTTDVSWEEWLSKMR
jgi:hypothetical protein